MSFHFGLGLVSLTGKQTLIIYAQNIQLDGVSSLSTLHRAVLTGSVIEAPLLRDVPIKYIYKEFNGSFLEEDVYRKVGSAEVDEAWEALGSACEYTEYFDEPTTSDNLEIDLVSSHMRMV